MEVVVVELAVMDVVMLRRSEPEWKWVEKKKNDCDEEHASSSTS